MSSGDLVSELLLRWEAAPRRGWFGEIGVSVLVHTERFDGNSSKLNFMSDGGVGYKFKNDWHVSAQWRHISNSGLGDKNSGVNGLGIAIGYTF